MALEKDIAAFLARLDDAIEDSLKNEVADIAKIEIGEHLDRYRFPYSRGIHGGGLLDDVNFYVYPVEKIENEFWMRIEDVANFQEDEGMPGDLAVAVTRGDRRYHMPGPRPFMRPAEEELGKGEFADALKMGLSKRGFTVS